MVSPAGRATRRLTAFDPRHDEEPLPLSWDPHGRVITFARSEAYYLVPAASAARPPAADAGYVHADSLFDVPEDGSSRPVLRLGPGDSGAGFSFSGLGAPAWSPSGRFLAFARNGDIWLARRGPVRTELGFSASSRGIRDWEEWEWEVSRLAAVAHYDAPTYRACREIHAVTRVSWSADERSLVYGIRRLGGTGFNEVRLLRLRPTECSSTGLEVECDLRLADDGDDPCFSPDGRWVTYRKYAYPDGFYGIMVVSTDGRKRKRLIENAEQLSW